MFEGRISENNRKDWGVRMRRKMHSEIETVCSAGMHLFVLELEKSVLL